MSMSGGASRLETERLILREMTEEDAPLIVKWRSDPEVYRYFLSPRPLTAKEHLDWYKNQYLRQNNRVDWIAEEKAAGKPVGVFGIKREKTGDREGEVSYLSVPECRGKGYAAEGEISYLSAPECRGKRYAAEAEISYLLAPECRGKGYAAEAVERILKFAVEMWLCHRAAARIHGDNQESIRFIRNLGFIWSETEGSFVTYRKILEHASYTL